MDHVIERLRRSKELFEEIGCYPNAVMCMENALEELYRYRGERVVVPVKKEEVEQDDIY